MTEIQILTAALWTAALTNWEGGQKIAKASAECLYLQLIFALTHILDICLLKNVEEIIKFFPSP